jgi:endoglucanase
MGRLKYNRSRNLIDAGLQVACIFLYIAMVSGQRPFPQHTVYAAGTIKPNRESQRAMDSVVADFYTQWKKHYIRKVPQKNQYYVFCNADGLWHGGNKAPNSISLSEGHGYGMIITAIMGGFDPDARNIFDGMLSFFKDHPSNINHLLMAWDQTRDSVISPQNSDDATDGDLDIAFALLLADKQWGSNGKYNYRTEADTLIGALMKTNINPETWLPMMGDFTEKGEPNYYDARPSDFIPDHFKAFAKASGDSNWLKVSDHCYKMFTLLQKKFSPVAGLFPDFIRRCKTHPQPAGPYFMEKRQDGTYSYNACRIPFRLACDLLINSDPRAKERLEPINKWIKKRTRENPENIRDGYMLSGKPTIGASGDNIAFIGTFGVGAMSDAKNQVWLNRIWDYASHEPLSDEEYYGNTLKMLCLIVMSGNWWE